MPKAGHVGPGMSKQTSDLVVVPIEPFVWMLILGIRCLFKQPMNNGVHQSTRILNEYAPRGHLLSVPLGISSIDTCAANLVLRCPYSFGVQWG